MHVAIVDDEPGQLAYLSRLVSDWGDARRVPLQVQTFPSAASFTFALEDDPAVDLVFLDIQMPGQDGMALARQLRAAREQMAIVFVTGLTDYMAEGYEVAALHYLVKPVKLEKLHQCLERAYAALQQKEPYVLLEGDGETYRVLERDIELVEAFAHRCEVTAAGRVFHVSQSIGSLEAMLDQRAFFRCHRSLLAGLRHVESIGKTEAKLSCGRNVPISRRSYAAFQQAFLRFYREGAP